MLLGSVRKFATSLCMDYKFCKINIYARMSPNSKAKTKASILQIVRIEFLQSSLTNLTNLFQLMCVNNRNLQSRSVV